MGGPRNDIPYIKSGLRAGETATGYKALPEGAYENKPTTITSAGGRSVEGWTDPAGKFTQFSKEPKEAPTPEEIAAAIEARATAGVVGKEAGKALVALPGAKTQVARSLNLVDSLLNHKGLSAVVGAPNPFKGGFGFAQLPGSDAESFATQLKQLEGQAFLEAFNTLRGAGAISEKEGEAATQAYANLSKSQSEVQFKKNVAEIKNILTSGYANLEQIAKGSAGLKSSSPPAAPKGNTFDDAIAALKADPSLAKAFDQRYGAGKSKLYLGN
jgi:hypothetical protein